MSQPPVSEWVPHDSESLRAAIDGMRRKRGKTWESLVLTLKGRAVQAFVNGRQANLRSDSIFKVADALGFEVVFREPATNRTQRRLAALKAKQAEQVQASLREAIEEQVSGQERDVNGHLNRDLTEAERNEVDELLARYSQL